MRSLIWRSGSEIEAQGAATFRLDAGFPVVAHRFLPTGDAGLERVLVRDADSDISPREAEAVAEWIASDAPLHVMRDHPHHTVPIPGGMWGCKGGILPDIAGLLAAWPFRGYYGEDQEFLEEHLWEKFAGRALVHDSHSSGPGDGRPFPSARKDNRFVGERLDAGGKPLDGDWRLLRDLPGA